MGYALFASRKIMLTNQINSLQLELDQIMNQKQNLLNFSANISDGSVSFDDVIDDFGNYNEYVTYQNNFDQYYETIRDVSNETFAKARESWQQQNQGYTDEELAAYELQVQERILSAAGQDYYKNIESKRIEAIENELEMKQKKIETKLTAAKNDLQSVEQAEGQAIQNATPKYNGVG